MTVLISDQPIPTSLDDSVRMLVYKQAAATGRVPAVADIASALTRSTEDIASALQRLAAAKVLILAPNSAEIWAANPFCAVPFGFRVEAEGKLYWGICIWDAFGIVAALNASDATVRAPCGDCGELFHLRFRDGKLQDAEGLIHFAVPARDWWKNIGFA